MGTDQITGIIRAIVPALLAYAVAKGWIDAGAVGAIGAAVVTLAAAVWSYFTNQPGKVIK